ncbi:beta-L-arabinofuranosidase domain-containing protein [Hymenobacter psoromatis]|uniref:beta-L-arabinofuranosidase domain-containing protein n=1 Tax=Hymenobacter psoromatis TaxID=1484116 RepID=UPI001CC10664|nr:beta-L-arabinofuranosidase domain-containing protein [Hymenobacter psoromatis]
MTYPPRARWGLAALVLCEASAVAQPATAPAPLAPLAYRELAPGAIQPAGWLRTQLGIMRDHSTGHLDETYPKLRDKNGWLGGTGDGWEETPYWLDGAISLAHLLQDKPLLAKVQRYVDWSIQHQRPSGYFGPLTKAEQAAGKLLDVQGTQGEDWWPRMVMLKVFQQHYQATHDARVLPFLTRYFRYQLANLPAAPLGQWSEWSTVRGGDNLLVIYWLYRQTGEPFLRELGELLYQQTTPWTALFADRDWVMEAAANQTDAHWMNRHGVNVGMGLKLPVVYSQAHPEQPALPQALRTGWQDIMTLHGLPTGMFSADEDLHGNLPTQGTELCAVVETMYSLEQAAAITGDATYLDALERIAYNALPTQTTDDYESRQYFQVANQVQVQRGVLNFSLPFEYGMNNVFGPYAGYTCCTANMHQGWTKFATHLWYATPSQGVAALEYAPNVLTTKVNGNVPVTIREETAYPFGDEINFVFDLKKPIAFPLVLRVPGWCAEATVLLNGQSLRTDKGGQVITLARTWRPADHLTLRLPMPVRTSSWARNSRTLERGPLAYALQIKEQWQEGQQAQEGRYFTLTPGSPWNYGLPHAVVEDPILATTVAAKPLAASANGFYWNAANAPITLTVSGRRLPAWQLDEGVAPQPVTPRDGLYKGPVDSTLETLTFIPYGCTKLRVVALPIIP